MNGEGHITIPMPTDIRSERISPLSIETEQIHSSKFLQHITSSWHRRGITNLSVTTPTQPKPPADTASKPRWKSPEFILYAILFIIVVPEMVRLPMRLSDRACIFPRSGDAQRS